MPFYLCNRQKCGEKCTWPECRATKDVGYAEDLDIPFEYDPKFDDIVQKGAFSDVVPFTKFMKEKLREEKL